MVSSDAFVLPRPRPFLLGLGGLFGLWALSVPLAANATILLFDEARDAATHSVVVPTGSGSVLPSDYGDNVTGPVVAVPGGSFTYGDGGEGFTPDVTLDFYTSLATPTDSRVRLWQAGYGDLVNVIFGDGPGTEGSPLLNLVFTAAPGYVVDLYGFDLAGIGADYTIAGIDVSTDAVSLFSQSDLLVEGNAVGPGHTSIVFDAPLSAPELLLQIDLSNLAPSIQDNVGIDSIRFGQTPPREVPEPAPASLLFAGLVLALATRSRGPR